MHQSPLKSSCPSEGEGEGSSDCSCSCRYHPSAQEAPMMREQAEPQPLCHPAGVAETPSLSRHDRAAEEWLSGGLNSRRATNNRSPAPLLLSNALHQASDSDTDVDSSKNRTSSNDSSSNNSSTSSRGVGVGASCLHRTSLRDRLQARMREAASERSEPLHAEATIRLLTKGLEGRTMPLSSPTHLSSSPPPPPPHSTPSSNVGRKSPRELDRYLMTEKPEYEPAVDSSLKRAKYSGGALTRTMPVSPPTPEAPPPPHSSARSKSRKVLAQQQLNTPLPTATTKRTSAATSTTEEAVSRIVDALQENRNNSSINKQRSTDHREFTAATARASLLRISKQVTYAATVGRTSSSRHCKQSHVTVEMPFSSSQRRRENSIKLHIYDLLTTETYVQLGWGCEFPIGQCFQSMNDGLHALGTGAYHCGIEINGIEYAYGANNLEGTTGVFSCIPKHSPGFEYRTTLDFGSRPLIQRALVRVADNKSKNGSNGSGESFAAQQYREVVNYVDGREVVKEMAKEYLGRDYDLLRRNCCTFARDAALRLGISEDEIPTWFMNLADAGAATQDVAAMTLKPITSMLSGMEDDDDDDSIIDSSRVAEESQGETGFEVIAKPCKKKKGRSLHKMEIVRVVDALEMENMPRVGAETMCAAGRRGEQVPVRLISSRAF